MRFAALERKEKEQNMTTPIPPPSAASGGTSSTTPPVGGTGPAEATPEGLGFLEVLVTALAGAGALPENGARGERSPAGPLPPGEEGKILPPVTGPLPSSPPDPYQKMVETRPAPPTPPAVARVTPSFSLPGAPQGPIATITPGSDPAPLQADPMIDPEPLPLAPASAARTPSMVTARGAEMPERARDSLLFPLPAATQVQQPAGAGSAAAGMERPSLPVSAPLHSPQWQGALGERLVWMVKRDLQQAELRLNPQHLGPVEVRIEIRNEQASIAFSAHHAVTRDALEAAIPRLREMLGESGVNLANVDISRQQGGSGQGQRQGGEEDNSRRQGGEPPPEEAVQLSGRHQSNTQPLYGGTRLVDLFA